MAVVLRILFLFLLCYLAVLLLVFLLQKKMVYHPFKGMRSTPWDIGLPYREVSIETSDGLRLCGWLVGEDKNRDVILHFHGNAGNISHRLDSFFIFDRLGLNTFIFDYRGYGRSQGVPSEKGTYLDAEAAWKYLIKTEQIPSERIILFGRSLGGAVAAWLATKVKARALILESTFTSVPDLGADLYPFLPIRLLARYQYNTRSFLPGVNKPVLIIHSPQDEMIPFSHGKALYEAAREPKQFLKISGSHNEGFFNSKEIYMDGLKKFLSESGNEI
jgi:fermentation-respiration switch protein FrsA (DUF1100 family)